MNHYLKQSLDRRDAAEISQISFSSEFEKLVLHSVISPYKKLHMNGFRHLYFSLELEDLIRVIFLPNVPYFVSCYFVSMSLSGQYRSWVVFLRKPLPAVLEFTQHHIQENNNDITQPIGSVNSANHLRQGNLNI